MQDLPDPRILSSYNMCNKNERKKNGELNSKIVTVTNKRFYCFCATIIHAGLWLGSYAEWA